MFVCVFCPFISPLCVHVTNSEEVNIPGLVQRGDDSWCGYIKESLCVHVCVQAAYAREVNVPRLIQSGSKSFMFIYLFIWLMQERLMLLNTQGMVYFLCVQVVCTGKVHAGELVQKCGRPHGGIHEAYTGEVNLTELMQRGAKPLCVHVYIHVA